MTLALAVLLAIGGLILLVLATGTLKIVGIVLLVLGAVGLIVAVVDGRRV